MTHDGKITLTKIADDYYDQIEREHAFKNVLTPYEHLKSGGFGNVYKVKYEQNGPQFAMKEIYVGKSNIDDKNALEKIRDEYRSQKNCWHPYVVQVYRFTCEEESNDQIKCQIFMELSPLGDLWK